MNEKNKAIRLHVENLDKLYVGREFKNFGELCIFLGIGKPTTNNGKSVINRKRKIARYFEFERIRDEKTGRLSHRIVITELHYEPHVYEDDIVYADITYANDDKVEQDKVEPEADE